MKGTTRKRGSTWSWQFTTGTARTGRKHHSRGGYRTRKEAQQALTEVLAAYGKGDRRPLTRPTDKTVGEWLDEWLAACQVRAKRPLKATTAGGYANAIDVWIKPHVGHIKLVDLDRDHLIAMYRKLRESGGKGQRKVQPAPRSPNPDNPRFMGAPEVAPEPKPLSPRTVALVHTIMRKALADAVARDQIPFNPIERIPSDDIPTHTPTKGADKHWTPAELRAFLAHAADDRLYPLWALAIASGARRGELAGLRWSDVDLDVDTITIRRNRVVAAGTGVVEQTPKTASSARVVDLDPDTIGVLRRWKAQQGRERMVSGEMWSGGADPYLFTNELGEPYRPDHLSKAFNRAQSGAGVPRISFHGLRHSGATALLAAGVQLLTVSERLGHSSTTITADIYGHVLREQSTDAARLLGGSIYGTARGT